MSRVPLLIAVLLGTAVSSHAIADDRVAQFTGEWELAEFSADQPCRITLTQRPGPAGLRVDGDSCLQSVPAFGNIVAWRPSTSEGVLLIDANGKVAADFGLAESDALESIHPSSLFAFMRPVGTPGESGAPLW